MAVRLGHFGKHKLLKQTICLPGHCTCYCPVEFAALEAKDGREDALKHVELEQRTVDSIISLIKQNGWQDDVDLTQEGNIHLIRSEEERLIIEENLRAAKEAGIDISRFSFFSEAECSKVCCCPPSWRRFNSRLKKRVFLLIQLAPRQQRPSVRLETAGKQSVPPPVCQQSLQTGVRRSS